MGLGLNIGYGAKITQNNVNDYFNGAFNYSWNGVFIALMGDPSLKMLYVKPPTQLLATETQGGTLLKWNKSAEKVDGYVVYRIDQNTQEYKEIASYCGLSSSTTTDTFYFDYCKPTPINPIVGNYKYAVRAFKWETTGSGSYQNLSLATTANTKHTLDLDETLTVGAVLYPNPCKGYTVISNLPVNSAIQVRVFNAVGQIIQSNEAMTDANGQFKLVLKTGNTGILSVVVSTEKSDFSEQLIVVE
jgi:hypothetical protein